MFNDMLKTQLLLKNVITPEDWEVMSEHIQYDFLYDNHFSELKETELFNERIAVAATAEPYIGRYYSQDYVRRKILRQTDEEILEQDKIMEKEIEDGTIRDPMTVDPQTGLPLEMMGAEDEGGGGSLTAGVPVAEPDLESEVIEDKPRKMPKGGEI